ncbi:MAG: hypothetical protein ACYC3S_07910 [Chloroflexota bacterium]
MLRGKKFLVAGAGALLAVALVAGAAFAQTTPTPVAGQSGQTKTSYGQYFLDQLASALNISRDQLNAAAKKAADNTIDKQQQDGRITADQATAAKQRVGQGNGFDNWFGMGRGRFENGGRGFMMGEGAYFDGVAKALGMTNADLQTQLRAGKTVTDLAKEKNVSADQVKSAVVTAVSAQLDQAVKDGKLTADQATAMKNKLNAQSADSFLRMGGKGPMGGGHMRGFPGQRGTGNGATTPKGPTT